jgi:carbamoyl-phosphate synthase small subunit
MPHAVIAHDPAGGFDLKALVAEAAAWSGIEGAEMARAVTTAQTMTSDQTPWEWGRGFGRLASARHHAVVVDFGTKGNILRELARVGCRSTVVPATASAAEVLAHRPDGVVLSNGPGDPAATGEYAVPMIRGVIEAKVPLFGICLGHQLLALALGGVTRKMAAGHHGANHPVLDHATGTVAITSMNHGFTVDGASLPPNAEETHISLFDGTNCGVRLKDRPVFSVQYHPEASPGPKDARYLFERFVAMIEGAEA